MIELYHGSTHIIQKPDCSAGRDNLDFGKGFYMTAMPEQAERWAFRLASDRKEKPIVNDYIEGGIANDRVIDTVNLYTMGLMTADVALAELSKHRPNNQVCILNQKLADDWLKFRKYYFCE